ncbi:hypothetical protein SCOR_15030 [Sulfidibacter corallicola]|uniref:Uncharacterized protein n=1 Tax=Sulfidibacter corallicola TaxID=2818388 RepID=A0A8A4TYB5_SULCO|nr:hypothetical protein [Sulfidibacter corallicola]QTD54218.1 hypothetical protein J3U87_17370 [Sulfidibacter corallicola]
MATHNRYSVLFESIPSDELVSPTDVVHRAKRAGVWEPYCLAVGYDPNKDEEKLVRTLRKRMKKSVFEGKVVKYQSPYTGQMTTGALASVWKYDLGLIDEIPSESKDFSELNQEFKALRG